MSDIARATFAFAPGGRRRVGAPTSESSSADWSSESWSGGAGTAARSDAALRTAEKGVEGVLGRSPHERSVVDGLGRKHMHSPAAATMALVQSALDTWSNDCICLEARLG